MVYWGLLFALLSTIPSLFLAARCSVKTFFAVGQRQSSKSHLDGGIFILSFLEGSLVKEAVLTSNLVGERTSYAALNPGNLYSTNAITPGELRQITFSRKTPFIKSTKVASKASRSTHLSLLGKIIAVANFGGSVSTFVSSARALKLADEFMVPLSLASKLKNESLSGIFAAPHPHMALPYKKGILVPDLGADLLWYFSVNRGNGRLQELSRTAMHIGDGPRHVVLHPKSQTIYVVNQVSATVAVLREGSCGTDRIAECDRQLLVDAAKVNNLSAAAIRVSSDGRFLYVSVRFPESMTGKIVGFELNSRSGDIIGKAGEWSSCGAHPRDFDIVDGVMYKGQCTSFLAIANRDSDNVVLLKRDVSSGKLSTDCSSISTSITGPISIVKFDA